MRHRTSKKTGTRRRSRAAEPRRRRTARPGTEAALAALAHEIRTPLTGILALSELIATADLPERERRWAQAIKSAAEHLAQLTTLVVDGVRAEARGLALRHGAFRPRALAEEVATTLAARAEAKGLAVEIAITDRLPELVLGDQVRLRAALENLIDNAVKFTEHGRVAFSLAARRAARGQVRLLFTVKDSGIGLAPAEIKRLFRPFAQANAEIATRYGGAGLGLVFVKRVAQAMGGDLAITSRPGRGSTFRLEVILAEDAGARTAEGEAGARPAGARRLRVLCAEDNPYARVVLNTILTELGHDVDFVGTGAAAIAAASRGYDVMLMDVALPDLDGLEATRRIRALPGTRPPIIGLSGHTEPGHEAAARAAGMDGYLAKPVSPMALAHLLARIAAS